MIPRFAHRNLSTSSIRCYCIGKPLDKHLFSSSNADAGNTTKKLGDRELKDLLESSTAFIDTKPKHEHDKWATLPYVEGTIVSKRNRHELDIARPKIDPRDTSIIIFPGDAAKFVGMAKSLECVPAAKDLFDFASEVVKYDVLKLCNEGPKSQLMDNRYGHVAIMTACLGNLELLREERPNIVYNCVGAAGFSLGEITALVFAGALPFDQALQLVQIRAEAIQASADMYRGGMAKMYFGPASRVIEACKKAKEYCINNNVEQPVCRISNFMCPGLKIISGSEEALQYLEDNYKKFHLKTIKRVKNTPAIHCALMTPTIQPIQDALNQIDVADPIIPVYSNVTCRPYYTADHIRKQLPQHLVNPIKWEQTLTYLYSRKRGNYFPKTIFCGPGFQLRSILQRVNSRAWRHSKHYGDCPRK